MKTQKDAGKVMSTKKGSEERVQIVIHRDGSVSSRPSGKGNLSITLLPSDNKTDEHQK